MVVDEIPGHDSSLRLRKQEVHFFLTWWNIIKTKNKERGILFQSDYNDIPIKQSESQLITGVACWGKQIPRHETGSVWKYPALRKKHCSASVCFRLTCSSYLPENKDDKKEQGGCADVKSRREPWLFVWLSTIHTGSILWALWESRSKTPGYSLNNYECS